MKKIKEEIKKTFDEAIDKIQFINELRAFISKELSPQKSQPVDNIQWIPIDMIQANDYNPNSVARQEMNLLYVSIEHDGYTQPVVVIFDENIKKYIIVDGFHRYLVLKMNNEIQNRTNGRLPVVILEKDINDRMASTIRHNRARGKHSIMGMSSMVFSMLDNGWRDEDICNELGMEAEELLKLKHLTGFSKLFKDIEYKKSWQSKEQIELAKKQKENGSSQN